MTAKLPVADTAGGQEVHRSPEQGLEAFGQIHVAIRVARRPVGKLDDKIEVAGLRVEPALHSGTEQLESLDAMPPTKLSEQLLPPGVQRKLECCG